MDIETLLKKRIGFGKITDQPRSDRATADEADAEIVHPLIRPKVGGILKHGKRVGGKLSWNQGKGCGGWVDGNHSRSDLSD